MDSSPSVLLCSQPIYLKEKFERSMFTLVSVKYDNLQGLNR